MALDPTGGGGWGLGALGAPSQSIIPLAPKPTMTFTPEQIAQMRAQAMQLQEPPKQNIQSWTQGLAELVRAMQGNREADFARQKEAEGRQQGADAIGQIYAPYLSQGGNPSPAAGAAPAGTLGSGPAGAIPSSGDQPAVAPTSTTTTDASPPRGIRNNNPLNIEDGDFAKSQPGYVGGDGRFAKFAAPEHGIAAADTLLTSYDTKHGLNTVSGIVNRWAPQTDGNNTKAYAADVSAKLGIGPDDPIPAGMRPNLIAAMAQHENGVPLPAFKPTGLLAPIPSAVNVSRETTAAPLSYAGTGPVPGTGLPNEITQGASLPPVKPTMSAPDASQASVAMARGQTPTDFGAYGSPKFAGSPISPSTVGDDPFSLMVNAIAGQRMPPAIPPADFARQAAAMEASKRPPIVPPTVTQDQPIAPADFARQAAALNGQTPPIPPAEFARQAAAMEAAKAAQPAAPLPTPGAAISPADFARAAATMVAMKSGGSPPPAATSVTPPVTPAAVAPSPVPMPQPRPSMPLPTGSAIPGAVGPTSVNGAPLVAPGTIAGQPPLALPPPFGATSVNGAQLPQSGSPPGTPSPAQIVSAIAGGAAPAPGATNPAAPIRVAQNGMPTSAAPAATGMASGGLPQPLTSPTGQVTQDQLTRVLANPWVPESAKASMLQMIQQRGQPQSMPVEGGTLMYNAAGQKVFIPEPKFGTVKIGSAEIPTVSHYDPVAGRWNTTTLAPGGGVQTAPGAAGPLPHPAAAQGATAQPDLSSIGAIQANEAAQAGAKKAAETGGEASAKYYDSLHKGLAGSAMIAAQQKQNIDLLRQVAASPDFNPGAGSEAALGLQRMAATLGIDPQGAAPREIFNQVAARILADQISGIKSMASETGESGGRIFKSMLELEEKANITPEDTAAGINAKLNLLDHAGDLMMKWGDMADDYAKEHGKLDPGFDKSLRSEISKARIPNAVPTTKADTATTPPLSDIEAEMRRRGKLPPAGTPAVPVSQ